MTLPFPARQILVPGIEIGFRVTDVATHRIVLDESRRVERLRQAIDARDLVLRLGGVTIAAGILRR